MAETEEASDREGSPSPAPEGPVAAGDEKVMQVSVSQTQYAAREEWLGFRNQLAPVADPP